MTNDPAIGAAINVFNGKSTEKFFFSRKVFSNSEIMYWCLVRVANVILCLMYIVVTVAVFEAGKYVLGSSSVLSKFLANR